MSLIELTELGVLPAAVVVCGALIVRRVRPRLYAVFLLACSVALLLAVVVAGWLTPPQDNRPGFVVKSILVPPLVGLLTLIALHARELRALRRGEQALAGLLVLTLLTLLAVAAVQQRFDVSFTVVLGALVLGAVWVLARAYRPLPAVLGLLTLGLLALYTFNILPRLPAWLGLVGFALYVVVPILPIPATAAVLFRGLSGPAQPGTASRAAWRPVVGHLALAAVLLGFLACTIVWESIWDQTNDGLTGLSLSRWAAVTAVGAGMLLADAAPGWRRLAGLAFAALVPLAMFGAFRYGWEVPYHTLTQARAARLQAALEQYHQRTGAYPADLQALVPRDIRWIAGPVILRGEPWCYQGSANAYRLAAVYREYFSSPLSVRVYASAGETTEASWACDERLAERLARSGASVTVRAGEPTAGP